MAVFFITLDNAKLMAADKRDYTFAQTFPTGTHAMWLYYWLAAYGINPMKDAKVITVPPPQMVANMRVGNMDGFCVGEPWGHRAIVDGIVGMQGNGPSSGTPVPSRIAIASRDYLAADRVGVEAMGVNPGWPGYLLYCWQAGIGQYDVRQLDIRVPPGHVARSANEELPGIRIFKPHRRCRDWRRLGVAAVLQALFLGRAGTQDRVVDAHARPRNTGRRGGRGEPFLSRKENGSGNAPLP